MQERNQNPSTSLIPIMLIGLATILFLQYFDLSNPERKVQKNQEMNLDNKQEALQQTTESKNDFTFVNKEEKKQEVIVKNQKNLYVLSNKGGRIERIYLLSSDNVKIPDSVVLESKDELEKKYQALEITRYKGVDFQPHLYKNQIVNPVLNEAYFDVDYKEINSDVTQVIFSKNIEFNKNPFKIYKIYRFLKNENFFHQITILKNESDKDFVLNGDLFFKSITALGPEPEDQENERILSTYGRFYHYNDSLKVLHGFHSSNGGIFSCSNTPKGRFSILTEKIDGLKYGGVFSRYFIFYSQYLPSDGFHYPDGLILENQPPYDGSSLYSTIFWDLKLSKKESQNLRILEYLNSQSAESVAGFSKYVKEDQKRTDALIIDQIVYVGLRSDEEHRFFQSEIAKGEFGIEEPESSVRDVIYSSGFLALFSKLRDGIIYLMKFINKYINNYGWAIIVIALFFKLITYPLNQVQAKTMKKIHELKPEIDRINEKYQDPAERQKRIMDLYKKYKINPAMGCFPMLIQIPIFIALYSAFSESIELWKSPFIWWMKDLSQPDTVYIIKDLIILKNFHINILPIIMVGSQLLQQKLTTVSTDPQQKFLMYFMPVIMIFFFWGMPSGVTLYWTVQNIITIIWQIAVEKFSKESKVT